MTTVLIFVVAILVAVAAYLTNLLRAQDRIFGEAMAKQAAQIERVTDLLDESIRIGSALQREKEASQSDLAQARRALLVMMLRREPAAEDRALAV